MILVIGPYHFQTRVGLRTQVLQNLWSGDRVIDSGTAYKERQHKPQSIDADVAFRPVIFLPPSYPRSPPRSVVFTD